ncbi:MAG: UDP-N-acetylmuramoyl-L-alanyl-D-glutamate--2,6-diaminopimelate ligase [Hyphomicrobiaceae bacterium]
MDDAAARAIMIADVTLDSRAVTRGSLFAAMPGTRVDGAQFVPLAIGAGAAAILCDALADISAAPVPIIRAADPRRAAALIAARFFGRQPAITVAVTGTSGKSSVADFTRQIFAQLGYPAASIGTLGIVRPDGSVYGGLTTPDPVSLHRSLADLAGEGVTHLAFEASSHGLDQRRLDGVRLTAAAFTNFGRDHLDYHSTVEAYFSAKMRLFDELLPVGATAVVNVDDPRAEQVVRRARDGGRAVMEVGVRGGDIEYVGSSRVGAAQRLELRHAGSGYRVDLPLIGAYQAENALVAAGLAIASGARPADVFAALVHLKGVPGRLETIGACRGALIVVDYAHKPEALTAVLESIRPFASGRLICVFGCGGDRDRGKRPIMGGIAVALADLVIVTDDNPRSEDPAAIRAEILSAAPGAIEIGDRAEAIRSAIASARAGDVVVIAGKGHETGQIVGRDVLPFSDQDVARAVIAEFESRG